MCHILCVCAHACMHVRACVCVCSSLHVTAFPYSPGVRWGLLSSDWTYRPLFSLSATCPLMSGKSFTLFPCGSTFQQPHTHTHTHTHKHMHIQKHTCTYTHTDVHWEGGMGRLKGGITKEQEGSEVQVNTCSVSKRRA